MIIVYITILCFFCYGLFHFWRYHKFTQESYLEKEPISCQIIILIPCLEEQKTIKNTIDHFESILPKDMDIPIYLITTAKEQKKQGLLTTKEIIEQEIIPKWKNVSLLHYPHQKGLMADQLNFAMKEIANNSKRKKEQTYLAIYNADSLPNKKTFEELRSKIKKENFPLVLQQYAYPFSNFNKLSFLLQGFAIYQANFELKIGLLNAHNKNHLHKHVVGHGLFLRFDFIEKINGFNTTFWCEDIYLSAYLENNNISITPLFTLEKMETPNSLSNLIKQNGVWFKTSFQCHSIYKEIFKEQKRTKNGSIGLLNELRSALNWLCLPLLITSLILFLIIKMQPIILLLFLISYCFYCFAYYWTTIKLINRLDHQTIKISWKHFFATVFATYLSNLGPLYALFIRPKEKHKTER